MAENQDQALHRLLTLPWQLINAKVLAVQYGDTEAATDGMLNASRIVVYPP